MWWATPLDVILRNVVCSATTLYQSSIAGPVVVFYAIVLYLAWCTGIIRDGIFIEHRNKLVEKIYKVNVTQICIENGYLKTMDRAFIENYTFYFWSALIILSLTLLCIGIFMIHNLRIISPMGTEDIKDKKE